MPESYRNIAYYQIKAAGVGSNDFDREKYGRRIEYIAW